MDRGPGSRRRLGTRGLAVRSLVVHLPAFRLERCGYEADRIAAVIAERKNAMRLIAITPAGIREGLRVGMTASEARALAPDVGLIEHRPGEEELDRAALVRMYDRLSDQVRFPWPDALVLTIGNVARLFGGEAAIARRAVELAHELGHRARAGVADDPMLALAVATWAAEDGAALVVPPGEGAQAVAPLPIEALHLPEEVRVALLAVGVRRVGEFATLDPASVAGRYPAAVPHHRISRGLPGSLAHLVGLPELEAPMVGTPLPGATTARQLTFVLPDLVQRLCGVLSERDLAAVRIRVVLGLETHRALEGRALHTEVVRVGRPTRSRATLERLIERRLEQVRVPAAIESLRLEVVESTPDTGWQPGLADRREATEPLPDLLARLSDQLGDAALIGAELRDRWRPEDAWAATSFPPPPRLAAGEGPGAAMASDDPVEVQEAFEQPGAPPRPSMLLPVPQRIHVRVEDGRPGVAQLGDLRARVTQVVGPERLCGAWWDPSRAFERTYWQVELGSRRAWIFEERSRSGKIDWRLHGWFD